MAKPRTMPHPLTDERGAQIYFMRRELVKIDDALCRMIYDQDGERLPHISQETWDFVCHTIDKVNRYI